MDKYKKAKKGALLGITGNLFLAALKIIVGITGRSFALIADGLHSASDTGSSGAVLIGLTIAEKPKDKKHPYGHGKAESLTSNSIAVALILLAFFMSVRSLAAFFTQEELVRPALITLWVALVSIIIKESLYRYKISLGTKLKSTSLVADAWHHRLDALSSIIVFLSIGASVWGPAGWQYLDKAAALFVSGMIIFIGVKIYRKSASELMDESCDNEIEKLAKKKALQIKGAKKVETIMVRKSGLDFLIDIHIEVASNLDVACSHQIAEKVEEKITKEIPQVRSVLVHIEPHGKKNG